MGGGGSDLARIFCKVLYFYFFYFLPILSFHIFPPVEVCLAWQATVSKAALSKDTYVVQRDAVDVPLFQQPSTLRNGVPHITDFFFTIYTVESALNGRTL